MKIAFFNSIPTWGGGEKWHFETSVYFAEKGYDVYFFANPDGVLYEKLQQTKVKLIPVKLSNLSFLNPFKAQQIKSQLQKHEIDLLVINHPGDLKVAGYAAHLAKTPRVIYRRGSAIPIKDRMLNRYIFKHFITDILANSNETKKTIVQLNNQLFPLDKIKVIYNHIDLNEFLNRTFTPMERQEEDTLIIGNLGRLAPQKNQRFLIDLSRSLKDQNIKHKIYIGGIGALETELKDYSKKNNTEDTVIFLGFQDNVKSFLNAIDIFILPSLWEGFGYVLAEASLCKKPIVAFDLSSNPEVVLNGQSGYLVEKNNIEETVKYIKVLSDPKLRDQMGQNGFEYCTKTFEREHIMKQIEAYFTK